jgi:RNA polymerase sigma factor (sigma-70 family)
MSKEKAHRGDRSPFLSDVPTMADYPLLTAEEERKLAGEIKACRQELLELFYRLPEDFGEIEKPKGGTEPNRKHKEEASGDVIERVLLRLRDSNSPILRGESMKPLFDRIHRLEARLHDSSDKLVRSNQKLIFSIAKNYANRGLSLLDLIQEGNLGLMKAVARFDPDRGYRFTTYASWWIWHAIDRAIKDKGRLIRMPVSMYEAQRRYQQALASLAEEPGEISPAEIMRKAKLSLGQFKILRNPVKEPVSLEFPVGDGKRKLLDLVPDLDATTPSQLVIQKEVSETLRHTFQVLAAREEEVIKRRFGINHGSNQTLEEIGRLLGITKEGVRRIEKRALAKLRRAMKRKRLEELRTLEA